MTKKTNNHFLSDKIALRLKRIEENKKIKILDCFSGKGEIYKYIKFHRPLIDLTTLDLFGEHADFLIDNVSVLESCDVSCFDIIDLDAYGTPFNQIKILKNRNYKGDIFFTFISSVVGVLPHEMLIEIGFTKEMIKASPAICFKDGFNHFKSWLSFIGITNIVYRKWNKKYYGYFKME